VARSKAMRLFALVMILLLAVCAGPPDDEEACAAYAEQLCGQGQRCSPESFDVSWGDIASCAEAQTIECKRRLSANGTKETAATMSSCADAFANLSCGAVRPEACVAAGTLPNDAACAFGSQCQSGSCLQLDPGMCGGCVPPSTAGMGCFRDENCSSPLVCRFGLCVRTGSLEKGASCEVMGSRCMFPLVCVGDGVGLLGKCSDPLQSGVGCGDPDQCDRTKGLVCDPTTLKCRPFVPLARVGEPCTGGCNGGAICGPELTCRPLRRQGEGCSGNRDCLFPAVCQLTGFGHKCQILDVAQCK